MNAVSCRKSRSPGFRSQRGMGIVELMVGLLIGLVMAIALAYFYLGSRQLSRTSDDVSRLQESGRNALELLGTAIRQAGYRSNVNAAFTATPLTGTNDPGSLPDTITLRFDAQEGGEQDCTGTPVAAGALVTYAFAVDRVSTPVALTCNGVAVVDNVEDMQITYGIDANKDGVIEQYKAGPTAAEFAGVVAVRIALLLKGPAGNTAANKTQTIAYNGANITKTDGYLRQAYVGTFTVRRAAF